MKSEFFLGTCHYDNINIIFAYIGTCSPLILLLCIAPDILLAATLIFYIVLVSACIFIPRHWGLYIQQGRVYYKDWRERSIDVQEIVGIKIMQAYRHAHLCCGPLTDRQGDPLFMIILLRSLDDEMYTHRVDDVYFREEFRQHVICYAVYDKEAVEYLLYLNPNIEIIL